MKSHAIKTALLAAASVAGVATAVLGSSMAHATTIVSTPGVNAMLDEDSTARGIYNVNGSLGFKKGTFPATINSRVPLVVAPAGSTDRYLTYLGVRFADTGADGQVLVRLMSMDDYSGAVSEVARFDSNSYAATPLGVTSSFYWKYNGCGVYLDPYNTYWYEVTQTKNVLDNNVKAALFDVKSYMSTCTAAAGAPTDAPQDIPAQSN